MSSVDLTNLFPRYFDLSNGEEITFNQSAIGDVGCVVWDAALVMCSYIDMNKEQLTGKSVLELGSGTGAVGLVASAIGANTVITDLPDIVPLMLHNITSNSQVLKGDCTALELIWGNKEHMDNIKMRHFADGVDYLLIADCVYYQAFNDLVDTIVYFTTPNTIILCSYEDRDLGNKVELQSKFFTRLSKHFSIKEISFEQQHPGYRSHDIHLVQLMAKKI